jgi:glycosyltransferase involved in cell wall biosynthesis
VAPRFSVVIPCYNEAGYIADAVRSLQNQSFTGGYEVVVVDNNSTDDTAAIAARLGARVVREENRGVCWARNTGTRESNGEIVVSADADTTYGPDWLAKIDRTFRADDRVVAVAGPCRYKDGPLWGRTYVRVLFRMVNLAYPLLGRPFYVTATNIAFRKAACPGYDVDLTQGGDELYLLRELSLKGKVAYDHSNPTFTSGRRLSRGLLYNLVVTLLLYYVAGYVVNRLFKRQVIGSAPAYRDSRSPLVRRAQTAGIVLCGFLLLLPFGPSRRYLFDTSDRLADYVTAMIFEW